MTRTEADKEDLIRDATALIERAEFLRDSSMSGPSWKLMTVGFRADGSLSLYFDQDPFYQFNNEGRLRRAWERGFLYRSEGDTLARLDRHRQDSTTTLRRSNLTAPELTEFRNRMNGRLTEFRDLLLSDEWVCPRRISKRGDIRERTVDQLTAILSNTDHFLSKRLSKRVSK